MKGQRAYFSALTSMRGVAAIGVVFFHVLAMLPQLAQQVPPSLGMRGYLWVDFFFVLSGFVLAHSNAKRFQGSLSRAAYRSFVAARFARIFQAYIVVLALFVLLEFLARDAAVAKFGEEVRDVFFTGPYSPEALVSNVLMLQSLGIHDQLTWNMPGWSLSAEWLTYLLVPLLMCAYYGCSHRHCVLLAVMSIGGLAGLQYWLGRNDLDITHDFGALRCLLEVALGYALYRLRSIAALATFMGRDGVALLLLLAIPFGLYAGVPDIGIVCLFALSILALSLNEGRLQGFLSARPLLFLGVFSYSVYLVQWLLLRSAKLYLAIYLDTNPTAYFSAVSGWWFAASMILGSVLAGALLYRWVERPMQVRLRQAFLRRA